MNKFLLLVLLIFSIHTFSETPNKGPLFHNAQDIVNINFSDGHGGKDIAGLLIDIKEQIAVIKLEYAIRKEKPHIHVEFGGDIMAKSSFNSLSDDLGQSAIDMMLEIARDPDVDVHYTLGNHEGDFGVEQTSKNIKKFVEGIREIKFNQQGNLAYKDFKISATNLQIGDEVMSKYIGKYMDYPIYDKSGTNKVGKRRIFGFQYGSEGSYFEKAPKLDDLKATQLYKFEEEVVSALKDVDLYNTTSKLGDDILYVTFASHEGVDGIYAHGDIFFSSKGRKANNYIVTPITSAHDHINTVRSVKGLEAEKAAKIIDTGAFYQNYGLYGLKNDGNYSIRPEVVEGKTKYGDVKRLLAEGTLDDKPYMSSVKKVQGYVEKASKELQLEKVWGELIATTNDGKIYAKKARTPLGTVMGNVNREGGKAGLALADPNYKAKYSDRIFGLQFSGSIRVDENAITESTINGKKAIYFTNEHALNLNPFGGTSSTLEMTPKELNEVLHELTQMSYMNAQKEYPTQMSDNLIQLKFGDFAMKTKNGEIIPLKSMSDDKLIAITMDQYLSFFKDHASAAYPEELPTFYRIFVKDRMKHEIKLTKEYSQEQIDYIRKHFPKAYNEHMAALAEDGFVDVQNSNKLIQAYPDHYEYRAPSSVQIKEYAKKFKINDVSKYIDCKNLMR